MDLVDLAMDCQAPLGVLKQEMVQMVHMYPPQKQSQNKTGKRYVNPICSLSVKKGDTQGSGWGGERCMDCLGRKNFSKPPKTPLASETQVAIPKSLRPSEIPAEDNLPMSREQNAELRHEKHREN